MNGRNCAGIWVGRGMYVITIIITAILEFQLPVLMGA